MCESCYIIGRGVGQVMFRNNAVSGALMLIGIACNAWQQALLALLGCFVATAAAFFSGYSKQDIEDGLYGFNGTLTGIAAGVFLEPGWGMLGMAVCGAALSSWVVRLLGRQKWLPGFTAPFILVVWLILAVCRLWFPSLLLTSEPAVAAEPSFFRAFSLHLGQVMFQGDTVLSGLFFLAAIVIQSRVQVLYAVWGALLPLAMAWMPAVSYGDFNAGLFGYNAVLCAMALGDRSWRGAAWATLAVAVSVALQVWGLREGVVTLTAPFVVSVWTVMGLRRVYSSFRN